MIVDSSALIAILRKEDESPSFLAAIEASSMRSISAVNLVESSIVAQRSGGAAGEAILDELVVRFELHPVSVDLRQMEIAREAHRRFGKGTGHPARLNFGDCFAYALAKATGRPLLYKGADFALTDIEPAVNPRFSRAP
ncbi:MAG: type II toxin-antitoxin system VapC family toxin [Tagaea sp.]|nr:type II toxin-antitoxin system VapC family toxin [Tagaea sp.]